MSVVYGRMIIAVGRLLYFFLQRYIYSIQTVVSVYTSPRSKMCGCIFVRGAQASIYTAVILHFPRIPIPGWNSRIQEFQRKFDLKLLLVDDGV